MGMVGIKYISHRITVRHHEASLVMPNSGPPDGLFYSHPILMKDAYNFIYPFMTCVSTRYICNFSDRDQRSQNAASDQGLHSLPKLFGKFSVQNIYYLTRYPYNNERTHITCEARRVNSA